MDRDVKTRRPYEGAARQARTRRTRAAVVEAARSLFVERGYAATTIEAISDRSDTPQATVYRLFSSKLGILKAVLDVSVGGDDEAVAMADRPQVRALLSDEDPKKQLAGFAALLREVMARVRARSSHPRRRGQIRRRGLFAARRDRSTTPRWPAPYRTLSRPFRRPAARAPRARRRRHHPRPRLSRGVQLAGLRSRLERPAVREVVESDSRRSAAPIVTSGAFDPDSFDN